MDQQWQDIKSDLVKGLSRGQYDLWVSTLDFLGVKEDRLVLGCRNRLHMGWLREKLEKKLLQAAGKRFPGVSSVEYIISEDDPLEDAPAHVAMPRQTSFQDLIRRPGPAFNPRFTFDQFVVGACNNFAFAASMAMAAGQQLSSPSLYLLSETGLGKSHLSHAVGNFLRFQKPDVRVQYVTAEQFANEMIYSLKNDCIDAFKQRYRAGCDILLMEKVEFLSGKEKVQSEFVYTMDELLNRGARIVCTGSAWPKDIPRLSNELQSRLNGTLVARIDRPDFKTRVAIIQHKLRVENVKMPMEVIQYLADRISGDVRQLESCLVGLIAKSNLMKVPITLHLAQEVTQTMLNYLPKLTIEHIQQTVCSSFQVSVADLTSPSRRKEIALARKMAIYLCRQYTTESLVTIGKAFKRSHSTVLYSVNQMNKGLEDANGKMKRQLEYISRKLETSCLYA